jgi:hypothetical protein
MSRVKCLASRPQRAREDFRWLPRGRESTGTAVPRIPGAPGAFTPCEAASMEVSSAFHRYKYLRFPVETLVIHQNTLLNAAGLRYNRAMNVSTSSATIASLRAVLSGSFCRKRVATCLLRMREAGVIPAGRAGRGGSAAVTVRQAALTLIVLAPDGAGDAIMAVADAWRVADFRLRSMDHTHVSDPFPHRQHVDGLAHVSFLDFLVAEIEALRGDNPDCHPPGWIIDDREAAQRLPDRVIFNGLALSDGVRRQTVIPGRLIADLAALFARRDPVPRAAVALGPLAALRIDPCLPA